MSKLDQLKHIFSIYRKDDTSLPVRRRNKKTQCENQKWGHWKGRLCVPVSSVPRPPQLQLVLRGPSGVVVVLWLAPEYFYIRSQSSQHNVCQVFARRAADHPIVDGSASAAPAGPWRGPERALKLTTAQHLRTATPVTKCTVRHHQPLLIIRHDPAIVLDRTLSPFSQTLKLEP